MMHRDVQDHDALIEVFSDIHMVTGCNTSEYNGVTYSFGRNMIVVREDDRLCLINTVRLDDAELKRLDALGRVTDILRIGSYHGYDDAFYLDRYQARLWELEGMPSENSRQPSHLMTQSSALPQADMSLFQFSSAKLPEGLIYLNRHGGIIITCDSLHNWETTDRFFDEPSAKIMTEAGFIGPANIGVGWKRTCEGLEQDFDRLQRQFSYRHLISAHGTVRRDDAYERVGDTVRQEFKTCRT